jgi:hypothetical protein
MTYRFIDSDDFFWGILVTKDLRGVRSETAKLHNMI